MATGHLKCFHLFLLMVAPTVLLCVGPSIQCSSSTLVRIDPSQVNPEQSCNDDLVCRTLQDATDYVSATTTPVNSSGVDCDSVVIEIPDGQHYITNPTHFGNKNVHFIGSGDSVTVLCDYLANDTTNSSEMHTWYFEYSESVLLRDIHFRGCGFPIRLSTLRIVQVYNCTFRYFTQAVLDIYNCQNVSVKDILVEHNRGSGMLLEAFRGNTGGVAIGYNNLPIDYIQPFIAVSHSIFINNSAMGFLNSERAVSRQVFHGRGGGLGLFMNETLHNLDIHIVECTFEGNEARLFGGGIYILIFSYTIVQHSILIERTRLMSNTGGFGGAGVQLSFLSSGNIDYPQKVVFRECDFVRNTGQSGGGIYIFVGNDGNVFEFERCNFIENSGRGSQLDFGAAVGLSFFILFRQRVITPRHEVRNCTFLRNSGQNGIFSNGYAPVRFSGENHFIGNTGPCLQIVGSLVEVAGHMSFLNNSVTGVGALHLLSFSQIRFQRRLKMEFESNIGQLGASIVVKTSSSLSAFSKLLFNPQCFIQYEDTSTPPLEWNDVTVTFRNNKALIASAVYMSETGTCTWFKNRPPYFNNSYIPDWPIWNYINNTNAGYVNSLDQEFSFGTTARQLSMNITKVSAWPGQRVSMPLRGLDHFNHSTTADARFFFEPQSKSISSNVIKFNPEIVVIADSPDEDKLLTDTFPLSYGLQNTSSFIAGTDTISGEVSVEDPFNEHPVVVDNFTLRVLPCPGGYQLTQSSSSSGSTAYCTCVDSPKIVNCENDQDSVILKSGLWAGYTPLRQPNLFFYPCPAGYCRCTFNSSLNSTCVYKYTESDRDLQCHTTREGILCGQCRDGHGVSVLLERCVTCSNGYGILIVFLLVADVGVFIVITILDIPVWAWLHPFLFYIQLAPYVSQLFPESFGRIGEYLYYLSSGTSFYFVYDFCLFENLSAQVSYALRYLPACVAAVVFTVIISIRKYILKRKSLHNHGYWWFVLLSFPLVVHTSLSILNCPSIPIEDGSSSLRWFVSGELKCFKGGHLVLSLVALSVLVFCVFLIVIGIVIPTAKPRRFTKRFIYPLTVSYRREVKWWSGVELGRRLLFLMFFIYFPRNIVYAILVLVVIIAVYGYVQPYKSRVANILELVVQVNFLIFMLLEATTFVRESLFKFPSSSLHSTKDTPQDISFLSWLLFPFYYFPLLLLIIVGCGYLIVYLRKRLLLRRESSYRASSTGPEATEVDENTEYSLFQVTNPQFMSQVVDIDYTKEEGEAELTVTPAHAHEE